MYLYFVLLFLLSGCVHGPDIQVSGVEDGKVYPDNRTITINGEQSETYTITLNGKPIKSGHVVEKNGTYHLSITGKKLWKTTEKKIAFTIDDQPPKMPTFKTEIQPGYFKEAKLELDEEEGVTYTVKLNGEPYNLSKPIQVEGEYELDIYAKKDNRMVSRRTESFIVDNQTFTQETVDAFLSFHFDGVDIENQFIIKWIGERIPVYYHGKLTSEDLNQLQQNINDMNQWLPVEFVLYDENKTNYTDYQIDVHFVPNEQFKDYGFTDQIIEGNVEAIGFTLPTEGNSRDGLLTTTIGIDSTVSQELRNSTILHELIHALGMYNHFENDKSSVLYPLTDQQGSTLNETDRKFVDMLYRADVIPGMKEEDIRQLWKSRIIE